MHQQPPHAPRSPNNFSRSGQFSEVSGRKINPFNGELLSTTKTRRRRRKTRSSLDVRDAGVKSRGGGDSAAANFVILCRGCKRESRPCGNPRARRLPPL